MEEKIPVDPRPATANFLNVLGVALSGLAILAVLISLFMTQMSLNEISLALNSIEEKLEVAEEDIEAIQEEEVEEAMEEAVSMSGETQIVNLGLDLTMEIPVEWQVQSNRTDELVVVTSITPYVITETIEIETLNELTDSYTKIADTDYVSIYQIGCAPSMGCYAVETEDEIFYISWNMVEGTEPVPENLDGPWFPSANFDKDDISEMMESIKPLTN